MPMTCPWIYIFSSVHKKFTTLATSSTLPKRPRGIKGRILSLGSLLVISVSITPGLTTLTKIFFLPTSRASALAAPIKPALEAKKIVICDRFLDSTIAYQGFGLGVDIKLIKSLGSFATQGIKPDLTILLDLPVKSGLKHRYNCKDRIEQRSVSYHEKVRRGYLVLAKQEPQRIKIVKVLEDKFKTQNKIREIVSAF